MVPRGGTRFVSRWYDLADAGLTKPQPAHETASFLDLKRTTWLGNLSYRGGLVLRQLLLKMLTIRTN
jgi:hypothetical protein